MKGPVVAVDGMSRVIPAQNDTLSGRNPGGAGVMLTSTPKSAGEARR
jgi:hypothetical protein